MAPTFLRFFTHCLLWSLGALLACWALALLSTFVTNGLVTFFSSVGGGLLWYLFFLGTFLSLLLLAWQLTAVGLAAQEPSVTFSSALPAAACPRPDGRGH